MAQFHIGIDLGMDNSRIAVYREGKMVIVPNDLGKTTTPSIVAFTDTERMIGDAAKNQVAMNPHNTVFDAKRLIGRKFDDPDVQSDMKHWPFKVVSSDDGKPVFQVEFKGENKKYSPEEISSMVLVKMKETAEAFLGTQVTNAVIAVPAYFNDSQRQATKDAGAIAGLNVVRIVTGPYAAALSYGIGKTFPSENISLIVDFGTHCDVTLMAIEDELYNIIAREHDLYLRGEDFDNRMVNHFVAEFKRKHKKDLASNRRALLRLRIACENAKRTLSSSSQASIEIDSLFEGIDFYTNITRARFEEFCDDIFKSVVVLIEKTLHVAKKEKSQIKNVIVAGGCGHMPKVQSLLEGLFGEIEFNVAVNPDNVVALGAAARAAMEAGVKEFEGTQTLHD